MRKFLLAALFLALPYPALADGPYKILRTVTVGGDGGFDYIVADSAGRRLYIARSGKINLDAAVGETVSGGKGHLYVAREDKDAVGVVDANTMTVTGRYPLTGPDGIRGGTPAGLALDAKRRVLFVACRNPAVMVMM